MNDYQSLSHSTWDCKYHLVWIPKYRKKAIYGDIRRYLGEVLRELALQEEGKILEGHLKGNHIHMWHAFPQNMRCRRLLVTSRARAPFILPEHTVVVRQTSQGKIFGPGGILCQPLALTRLRSDPVSPDKKRTIVG